MGPQFTSRKGAKGRRLLVAGRWHPQGLGIADARDTGRLRGSFSKTNRNCTRVSEHSTDAEVHTGWEIPRFSHQDQQTSKGRLFGTWIPGGRPCHLEERSLHPLCQPNRTRTLLLCNSEPLSFYLLSTRSGWTDRYTPANINYNKDNSFLLPLIWAWKIWTRTQPVPNRTHFKFYP